MDRPLLILLIWFSWTPLVAAWGRPIRIFSQSLALASGLVGTNLSKQWHLNCGMLPLCPYLVCSLWIILFFYFNTLIVRLGLLWLFCIVVFMYFTAQFILCIVWPHSLYNTFFKTFVYERCYMNKLYYTTEKGLFPVQTTTSSTQLQPLAT